MEIPGKRTVMTAAAAIGLAAITAPAAASEEPVGLFLTWQQDPTTTMTIDWHSEPDDRGEVPASTLEYKELGTDDWSQIDGEQHPFPFSHRIIHRVELTELEPGTMYRFRMQGYERAYNFRTMPDDILSDPIVFATGGDTRHSQARMDRTNRAVMEYEPDFIFWGGDLAYADGVEGRVDRWYEFFDSILNTLVSDEGRVVPIVLGIGNHEMYRPRGGNYFRSFPEFDDTHDYYNYDGDITQWREENAPYFFGLFAFPGHPGYDVLDFGDYLSLIALDTDHASPIDGPQTDWLGNVLAQREHMPHIIPFYHVPAFPSHRSYSGGVSTRVREHWVPLFEQHGVRVAFENHDHTYKRTHPIRNEQIDPSGIVYIGDGAWGVGVRPGDNADAWYINRFASVRHAIIGTLHGPHQHYVMVSEVGDVIDEYPRTPYGILPTLDLPGQGTANDPYEIATLDELQMMGKQLHAHYALVADIDASETADWNDGRGFEPIGGDDGGFSGSLDGRGHTITNLTIRRDDQSDVGLLGEASANVRDLRLVNFTVEGGNRVGALAGNLRGEISNVHIESARVRGRNHVGGLGGRMWADVERSSVREGRVRGTRGVGGLAGRASGSASIVDSFAAINVTGVRDVGGLAGHSSSVDSTFHRVFAAGPVEGDEDVGGLLGGAGGDDDVEAAYWDRQRTGQEESALGEPLERDQMIGDEAANYMDFDFDNVWQTVSGDYPTLRE